MDSRWLWGIVLIIIVVAGGWYVFSHPTTTQAPSGEMSGETASSTDETTPGEAMIPAPVTVTYSDQGFSPASVTVVEGQTVTWVNQSSGKMWVASAVHPTHAAYDSTNKDAHCAAGYAGETPFDECAAVDAGASYSFIFTKAGTWKYHNHAKASDTGEVIVTASPAPGDKGGDMTASTSVEVNVR